MFNYNIPDGDKTYKATFRKAYFDSVDLVYTDLQNRNRVAICGCYSHYTEIVVLFVFVFVAFFIGILATVCFLNNRLKKKGYHLKGILRARQTLEESQHGTEITPPVEMQNDS